MVQKTTRTSGGEERLYGHYIGQVTKLSTEGDGSGARRLRFCAGMGNYAKLLDFGDLTLDDIDETPRTRGLLTFAPATDHGG